VAPAWTHVHDATLSGRCCNEPPDDRRDGPEVGDRGVQSRCDSGGKDELIKRCFAAFSGWRSHPFCSRRGIRFLDPFIPASLWIFAFTNLKLTRPSAPPSMPCSARPSRPGWAAKEISRPKDTPRYSADRPRARAATFSSP